MAADIEIPLSGGRITADVVRVGDSVRRPCHPSTLFVRQLLTHLEEVGFAAVPRHLGTDAAGREVFSFIPGETYPKWQRWSDQQVTRAARLIRSFHDATASSALTGEADVICHGDPGPNNFVFRDGSPVALIDFDFAVAGERIDDLAYMGWAWCLSSKASRQPVEDQARQLRVLCDAYQFDPDGRREIVARIAARQALNADWWRKQQQDPTTRPDARAGADEVIAWSERERAYTLRHRDLITRALL